METNSELKNLVKLKVDNSTKKTRFCEFVEYLKILADALPFIDLSKKGSRASKVFFLILPIVFNLLDTICNSIVVDDK